ARAWYSEIKKYTGGPVTEQNYMLIGHYTQMVWEGTKHIGAGKAKSRDGRFYVCCNYDPPGNVLGQVPAPKAPALGEKLPGAESVPETTPDKGINRPWVFPSSLGPARKSWAREA